MFLTMKLLVGFLLLSNGIIDGTVPLSIIQVYCHVLRISVLEYMYAKTDFIAMQIERTLNFSNIILYS